MSNRLFVLFFVLSFYTVNYNCSMAKSIFLTNPQADIVIQSSSPANIAGQIRSAAPEFVVTWTYNDIIELPDADSNWTIVTCDPNDLIPEGCAVIKAELYHSITHPWIGDLDIQVTNETNIWTVRSNDIDNDGNSIDETLINTDTFFGDNPNQFWYYKIRDVLSEDIGQLNEMILKVYYTYADPDIALDISDLKIDCSTSQTSSISKTDHSIIQADTSFPLLLNEQEINKMFDQEGKARVIVNLKKSLITKSKAALINGRSTKQFRSKVKEVRDSVLNKFKSKKGFKTHHEFDNIASFSASVTPDQLNELLAEDNIASIEPVKKYKCFTAQGLPLMNAFDNRSADTGSGISIAVCDTGIDYYHPMLGGGSFPNNKVIGGYDFGDNDSDPFPYSSAHGTACSGIAAGAIGLNGDYIGGVAPDSKLYALKVTEGEEEDMYTDTIASSWDWCVTNQYADPNNPIMVISVSLGGGNFSDICDNFEFLLAIAAQNAANAGITILAASGNDGYCDSISSPACVSNIISVGATYDRTLSSGGWCVEAESCVGSPDPNTCDTDYICNDSGVSAGDVSCYSNSGPILDLLAPSYSVTTADISGADGYDSTDYTEGFAGTSAACPYAAGAAAVIQQRAYASLGSFLSPAQVRSLLADTGTLVLDPKSGLSKPLVNLGNALDSLFQCDGDYFTINNYGSGTLTITDIDLPEWISTNQPFPAEIPPASSLNICLTGNCNSVCGSQATYPDSLTIHSDDPDTPALVLPVTAMCALCNSSPIGDITGDCIVNLNDIAQLASTWLDCGYVPSSYCN